MGGFDFIPTQAEIEAEREGKPLGKGMPRVLEKKFDDAAIEKHRLEVKAAVWKRDGARCRCCGATATEMHELHFRSLGGERSTFNSIAVCTVFEGGNNCHRMLQRHVITYEFLSETFGADSTIRFRCGTRVWLSRTSLTVGE